MKFDKNDWAHLHDAIFDATGKDHTQEELEKIYYLLPGDLQKMATIWGMSDTVFRDLVYTHFQKQ